jgi:DNA polymerase III alpha subunit
MQKLWSFSALLILVVVFSWTALAYSQMGPGGGNCLSNYDPKTETVITGTVQQVTQQTGKRGWNGTHLTVQTDSGAIRVHLGPSNYLAKQQFSFGAGDQLSITGSKVTMQGTEVLIAREIKKGDKTLVLRNAQGIPNWSGGRCR